MHRPLCYLWMYQPLYYLYYRKRNQVHTFVPDIVFCLPPRKNLVTNKDFFSFFSSMPLSFVPWKNPRSTIFCTAFQNPRVTPKRKNKLLAGDPPHLLLLSYSTSHPLSYPPPILRHRLTVQTWRRRRIRDWKTDIVGVVNAKRTDTHHEWIPQLVVCFCVLGWP